METIDTHPLVERTWDGLFDIFKNDGLSDKVKAFVSVVAEGYPFPTNLDKRVPETAGMAPESEQDILIRCLKGQSNKDDVLSQLGKLREDSRA
jgi:hypothetical protein